MYAPPALPAPAPAEPNPAIPSKPKNLPVFSRAYFMEEPIPCSIPPITLVPTLPFLGSNK